MESGRADQEAPTDVGASGGSAPLTFPREVANSMVWLTGFSS